MTSGSASGWRRHEARALSLMVFLVGLGGLAVARWLDPAPGGLGTHQQLGLGPCTFLWLTDWPCPLCGATTTWALLADLRPGDAFWNQPFAWILFHIHLAITLVAGLEVVVPAGRWQRLVQRLDQHDTAVAIFFLVGILVGWTYRIAIAAMG